jgi:hypothetical protein
VIGWPPPESAPAFDPVRWVTLYEGPYRDAKPILAKLEAARFPNKLEMPDPIRGTTVLILVPAKMETEARQVIEPEA